MTIDTIYNDYIESKLVTLDSHTVKTYISAYEKHVMPLFGYRDIDTINFIDYQKFANNLLVSGKKPKTVRNILRIISGIYKFAIKNNWYQGEVFADMVELPKYDNKFYVTISPEIQKKYLMALKNAKEPIFKDIFLFLLHGRRLGEVLNLKWDYLDLNQGIVYYPATRNKSRKHLSYELTNALVKVLRNYQLQAIEKQGTVFITGYVFINPNTNKKFTDIRGAWNRLLESNNLSYTKLHSIRHILGTYLINELNMSLVNVSYVLGHSDTKITQRYVNIKPQIAKDAIQTLFNDFKTEGEKHVEQLNQAIVLGESIQAVLFHDTEYKEKPIAVT